MSPKNLTQSIRRTLGFSQERGLVPLPQSHEEPLPSGRHSIALLIDTSPSLEAYVERIRAAYQKFAADIRKDLWLRQRVDVSIWALDDHQPAKLLADCVPAHQLEAPKVPPCWHTPLYGAMTQVLSVAAKRTAALLEQHHCDEASNWVFVLSDYRPTDAPDYRDGCHKALARAAEAGVNLFLLTVGDVDNRVANELAQPSRAPVALESVEDFTRFFAFLSHSLRTKSMSMPGVPLRLEFNGAEWEAD